MLLLDKMERELLLTNYISIWNWNILAIIFFSFSLLFFAMEDTLMTIVFSISFFAGFIIAEFMMLLRRKELNNKDE